MPAAVARAALIATLLSVALPASALADEPMFPKDGPKIPTGLVPIFWPKDNPYTPQKAELGWLLYFDKRLSADQSVACATCHDPKHAFTDGKPFSSGIRGQLGGRSAPTVINRAYSLDQFWDILSSRRTLNALKISFGLAFAAALVNLVMGMIIVWALVRYRFPGRRLFDAIVDIPFALPTAVAGVALTALFAQKGWLGAPLAELGIKVAFTPVGIFVAMIFIGIPFVVRTVQPVLIDLDTEIEELVARRAATAGDRGLIEAIEQDWRALEAAWTDTRSLPRGPDFVHADESFPRARRGQRQHAELLPGPRHRRGDEAHPAPPAGGQGACRGDQAQ